MSMMLKTVNPEAAAVLEGEYPKALIGSPILYTLRPGVRRGGRTTAPGFIMSQNDDGTCNLMIFFEPEDVIDERYIPEKSEHQVNHCWEYLVPPAVKIEIDNLYSLVEELRGQIFGEYEQPPKSVMEYLADFDKRLSAAEAKGKKKG